MSMLHDERVARVETLQTTSRYPRVIGRNARGFNARSEVEERLVLIHSESGAVGWSVLVPPRAAYPDDHRLRTLIAASKAGKIDAALASELQREAFETTIRAAERMVGRRIGDLFDPDVGVIEETARPFDLALHDLAGVILGLPVYELIGFRGHRFVPCYDGAIYQLDLDPSDSPVGVQAVIEACTHDYALGYRAFKLKIGRGHRWLEPDAGRLRDIEVTRAVRECFPDCEIMVDANDGYSSYGFTGYVEAVIDCDLFWIEEPFPENEVDLTTLRAILANADAKVLIAEGEAPIADGEDRAWIERRFLDFAEKGIVDVALFDIVGHGITGWRKVMPTLQALGAQASPHTWGSPLKTIYASHVAAGLGNVPTIEGVPGETDGVDTSGYRLSNGTLQIPATPGFGLAPPDRL